MCPSPTNDMSNLNNFLVRLFAEAPDERIPHPSGVDPSEATIVNSLEQTLDEIDGVWADKEVNLWERKADIEGSKLPPQEVIREFDHPLQPDIDLLIGSGQGSDRTSPLVGIEAKYFSKYNGIRGHQLLPKRVDAYGNDTGGFYSGLGQALSLLSMGLDAVYLWHIFKIDETIYSTESIGGDQKHDHRDVLRSYTRRVRDLIDSYDIPVGYIAHGIAVDFDNQLIQLCPPREAPVTGDEDALIRGFLEESLTESDNRSTPEPVAPECDLGALQGSGSFVTVEAEIEEIYYVKKDSPEMPDLKGELYDPCTGDQVAFIVDTGISHPYFEEGARFRFEDARDHYYEANEEVQLRVTEKTTIKTG